MKYLILLITSALFLVAAIGWDTSKRSAFSDESLAHEVSSNLSIEIISLLKESERMESSKWSERSHAFYLVEKGKITRWSKVYPVIEVRDCEGVFDWKLIQSSRSDLLVYKKSISSDVFLIGVIPLQTGYDLVNQYLTSSWNKRIFPYDGIKILNAQHPDGTPVTTTSGTCLFKIQKERDAFITNPVSVILATTSILLAIAGVWVWIRRLHEQKKYLTAFISLFGVLALMRIAMVQLTFPARWIYSGYFDPKHFASSSFNASVGDFFLNSLIVAVSCAYFFRVYSRMDFIRFPVWRSKRNRWLAGVFFLTASYFSFLFPHLFVEAIFHDSIIPIDITASVNFDGIRSIALGALLLGCLASFFFVHSFIRLAKLLVRPKEFIFCLTAAALIFIVYFLFSELNYWPTILVGTSYFIILFFTNYYRSLARIGYRTFPFIMIGIIAYSSQATWGIWRFSEERKLKSMLRTAAALISNDVLGEYLLEQAGRKVSNDLFLVASIESPLLSKNQARQKVRQVYLSDYFDRYSITINLYHADGSPADAESTIDFATTIKSFQAEASKTGSEGVYLIRNANVKALKRYLAVIPVKSNASVRGYVVLDLSLKRIVPHQVYPELLSDNRFAQSLRSKDVSYAAFSENRIIDQYGSFNYDRDFEVGLLRDNLLYTSGIKKSDYLLVGASDETDKRIVLATRTYPWFGVLANFSFLFVLGIILIFGFLTFYLLRHLAQRSTLNYSARIQVFAYMAFVLPLIAVSVIAMRMITVSNDTQSEREIEGKGLAIAESLSAEMEQVRSDSLNINNLIKDRVREITQATSLDVNLYSPAGEQVVSSQPAIFKNKLIMPLPARSAWEKINTENYNAVRVTSEIGALQYNNSLFAIKSSAGKLLGILELPFFNSTTEGLKSGVISNILVTFTVVFILFSLFAANAIGKLTSPLRFIARKLNTTSLASNQPIEWTANDEIGRMVREYNRMLANLDQSKTELARKEKESAWREIAKQVAHEIKNPLTPMKLTLQQMERSMIKGELTKEKTENSVQTLLAQVETLNGIAGSFSAFATMPAPLIARVEVNSILRKTVSLFENHTLGIVSLDSKTDLIFAEGDEQLLGRIFSNIILNGLQSAKGERVKVNINVSREEKDITVTFRDNGLGIPAELKDKIFLPHFSTKETGSGLGLAIAKQGIEQMGGTIGFESSGIGTSFS